MKKKTVVFFHINSLIMSLNAKLKKSDGHTNVDNCIVTAHTTLQNIISKYEQYTSLIISILLFVV